jgi:hypothetical protein
LAQSSIAWAIDSIANPQLNDDPGTINPFPGETFGLGNKPFSPSQALIKGRLEALK